MMCVQAEGTVFYYLLPTEVLASLKEVKFAVEMYDSDIVERIRRCPDVRVVVFESMIKHGYGDIRYLFWSVNQDLEMLDRRVVAGTYTDADFAGAVKTVHQATFCSQCDARWDTLIMLGGEPYPRAPELHRRKFEAASNFCVCPACRASLRQAVVKILGPADDNARTLS